MDLLSVLDPISSLPGEEELHIEADSILAVDIPAVASRQGGFDKRRMGCSLRAWACRVDTASALLVEPDMAMDPELL